MPHGEPDYRRLFHQSSLAHMVIEKCDGQFYVVMANNAAIKYFHTERDEIHNNLVSDFLDLANTDHILQAMHIAYNSRVQISVQVLPKIPGEIQVQSFLLEPIMGDKGEVLWINMQARPPALDNAAIERERDDAISMFTTVFDLSDVGITVTDHHGRFVRLNNAFIDQTGWQTIDLIGEKLTKIIPPEEHEIAWKRHEEALKQKRKNFGEIRILCADGSHMDMLVTSVMLELSNGRSFRVTTCVDVTELKRARDEAHEANKAKSAFLANMSHELRTPLNAIIGFSEMMINGTLGTIDNEHYVDYLGDIKFSAQHLLQIINDVLDMSKIEAGKMPLDEEPVDIKGLLSSVLRLMCAKATENHITFIESTDDNLPKLMIDERLIRQVFLNIISNAIKFSPPDNEIAISAHIEEGFLNISMQDHGIGIDEARLAEIMEPFGQIHDPKLNSGQGTGLGLPIAKAMMEMHGGTLVISSIKGEGTTAMCKFPESRFIQ